MLTTYIIVFAKQKASKHRCEESNVLLQSRNMGHVVEVSTAQRDVKLYLSQIQKCMACATIARRRSVQLLDLELNISK